MSTGFRLPLIAILAIVTLSLSFSVVDAGRGHARRPYIVIVTRFTTEEDFAETPYTDCGSGSTVNKVEVIPCEDPDACILHTGSNATFKLSFVSKINSTSLKAVVHGIVAGVPVPFHVPQPNACHASGVDCPIKEGQSYNYVLVLPVLSTYPKLSVTVKWELVDQLNKDVVCVLIPAKLR